MSASLSPMQVMTPSVRPRGGPSAAVGRGRLNAGTVAVYRSVRVKGEIPRPARACASWSCPLRRFRRYAHTTPRQAAEWLAAREMWQECGLVFCREDGTPPDCWPVRKEFQKLTKAARLGGARDAPRAAALVRVHLDRPRCRLEDIRDLVGHGSTSGTETVYRHEIRPALTKGTTVMNRIMKANAKVAWPEPRHVGLPIGLPKLNPKNSSYQSGRRDSNPRPLDP
jgi:hypothetical protein